MVNNYIKANISGREVGLIFGLLSVQEFRKALAGNLDLFFDGSMITDAGLAKLIYAAHQNNRFINPSEPAIDVETIYSWIVTGLKDEEVKQQLLAIIEVWQASEHTQKWLDEIKKKTGEALEEIEKINKASRTLPGSSRRSSRPLGRRATGRKK